ncbi:MAG: hybrid sensor histidine kinase/response regulator [Bacteroidales bacterium]|nr:hybrid sensor histidine kinase/response regulator [Bacteroidales bacterium]MBN2756140.1 hybrid sensor histidine kinase/response regulator [Bacteroidales bacterium]
MDENKPEILYVDDEVLNIEVFKHSFKNNYDFIVTSSPVEALKILENTKIKILITDQRMPEMTGLELIGKVNKKYPEIICIMLTAFVEAEIILEAINKGDVYRYITKPWQKEELKIIINNALQTYNLKAENKKLVSELIEKNTELERHRTQLESIVDQQTKEIKAKNTILQELVATKDKFFSIIAHDLKSHFTVVLNSAELLLLDFKSLTEEKRRKITTLLHHATNNTYNLLENLLMWSKSQTDTIKFKADKINLFELTNEVLYLYQENYNKKSIEVANNIKLNTFITADYNSVNTVLRNLLSNAIKFTKCGGKIIIKSEKIITKNNENYIKTSVIDNGLGIEKEHLNKLFKIDGNYSTKGTENEEGTGLGLILCKEFITKNGGEIFVESEIGKGTSFSFTLKSV